MKNNSLLNENNTQNYSLSQKIEKLEQLTYKDKILSNQNELIKRIFNILECSQKEKDFLYVFKWIEKLLKRNTLNFRDLKKQNKTILMTAIEKNFIIVIKRIFTFGVDLEEQDQQKETAIFYLAKKNRTDDEEVNTLILNQKPNLEHRNNKNETVLLKALKNHFVNLAASILLLNFNVITWSDHNGVQALDWIFYYERQMFYQIIIKHLGESIFLQLQTAYKLPEKIRFLQKHFYQTELQIATETTQDCEFENVQLEQNQKQNNLKKNMLNFSNQQYQEAQNQIKNIQLEQEKYSQKQRDEQEQKKILEKKIQILQSQIKIIKKQNQKLNRQKEIKKKSKFQPKCIQQYNFDLTKVDLQSQQEYVNQSLQNQLEKFDRYINNFQASRKDSIQKLLTEFKKMIQNFFQNQVDIEEAGSYDSNLNLPFSNINLEIQPKEDQKNIFKRDKFFKQVQKFKKILQSQKLVENLKIQRNLFLFVYQIRTSQTYFNQNIELVFRYKSNNLPKCSQIIKEYLKIYPQARVMYLIFKVMLHKHQLDNPLYKGLNSICILSLIVAFLITFGIKPFTQNENKKQCIDNFQQISHLYQNFLYFYTYNFDPINFGIKLHKFDENQKNPFFLKDVKQRNFSLVIVHPYKDSIILTKSFKRTNELLQIFQYSYFQIYQMCQCKFPNIKVSKCQQQFNNSVQIIEQNDCNQNTRQFQKAQYKKFDKKKIFYYIQSQDIYKKTQGDKRLSQLKRESFMSQSTKIDSLFQQNTIQNDTQKNLNVTFHQLIQIFNLNLQNTTLLTNQFSELNIFLLNYNQTMFFKFFEFAQSYY